MEVQPSKRTHGLRITLASAAALALLSLLACTAAGIWLWGAVARPRWQAAAATPSPKASPSPRAVSFPPAATLEPAAPGWRDYESITRIFTLRYPDTWQVVDEDDATVFFDAGPRASSHFQLARPTCGEAGAADSTAVLDCLVRFIREDWLTEDEMLSLRSRGTWEDGDWHGYLVEANVRTVVEGQTLEMYEAWLIVPLDPGTSLLAWLGEGGVDDVPAGEWRVFIETVKSMRPGGVQQ